MKTIPIFLAFLMMGVADAMGPNSDSVKDVYKISDTMATLLTFVVFIAFAMFSVPGGLLAARVGKKKLLLLGLGLNVAAMLVPSLIVPTFPVLLACIFLLGVGTTFLQVAGNPIMRDVSPEGTYGRNLSLAQGIKGIGSAGSTLLVIAIAAIPFLNNMGWRSCFPVFCVAMGLAFVLVAIMDIKEAKADVPPSIGSSLGLLGKPVFLMAVMGIFLYVGAEVCMGRFLKPALKDLGASEDIIKYFGPAAFFIWLTVGRLLGSAVLTVITSRTFFRLSALLGLAGALLLMAGSKPLAVAGVVCAGLGFANIWPMLFSITVEEKPESANELSGLMCMAISGGAIVPLIMGAMIDAKISRAIAFVVPAFCFAYLLLISMKGGKAKPATAKA